MHVRFWVDLPGQDEQTMGGPPMLVDVPKGMGQSFEAAGQKGAQTGGLIGAGLVGGAAGLGAAAEAAPVLSAIGEHLSTLKTIINAAEKVGIGAIGYKEARDLWREFGSNK